VLDSDPMGKVSVDPECADAVRAAADMLSRLGHDVSKGYPAILKECTWPDPFFPCIAVVVWRELTHYGQLIGRALTEAGLQPSTWEYAQWGRQVTVEQYAAGIDALRAQAREIERWWDEDGWNLLLTPTIPVRSPRIGEIGYKKDTELSTLAMALSHYTVPYNV